MASGFPVVYHTSCSAGATHTLQTTASRPSDSGALRVGAESACHLDVEFR